MTQDEIEHMWKVASNNPNHDTNWHDPVVIAFAKLVAAHTLMNIDPSSFMSYQEGFEAGVTKEREECNAICKDAYEWAELRINKDGSDSHYAGRMRAAQDIGNAIRTRKEGATC